MYFEPLFKMTYDEYVDSLLDKYGKVKEPYFIWPDFSEKNRKISRTDEGLVIHHIDEDEIQNLSSDDDERIRSEDYFKYQLPERLVYCNYVEHMILHMKIVEKELAKPSNERINDTALGIGGFGIIVSEINYMLDRKYNGGWFYSCYPQWKIRCAEVLDDWWATVFVQTIRYFVESVLNRQEFREWYDSLEIASSFRKDLDILLTLMKSIYSANTMHFDTVVTEYFAAWKGK